MDGRDETALRNSADQQASETPFETQDGRDQRRDPLPPDFGEPPETLQVIPGRFLHDPVPAPNPPGANPASARPMGTSGRAPANAPINAPANPSPSANLPSSAPYSGLNGPRTPSAVPSPSYPYRSGYTPGYANSAGPAPSVQPLDGGTAEGAAQANNQGSRNSSAPSMGSRADEAPTLFGRPQSNGQGYSAPSAQRGPRSVPVLSRYPTPGQPTPGQPTPGQPTPGRLAGAAPGVAAGVAAGALAGAGSLSAPGRQGQQNGTRPAVAPQEQRPFIVEEVQELPVHGMPAPRSSISAPAAAPGGRSANAPATSGGPAPNPSNRSYLQVGATESGQSAQRGGAQPFAGAARVPVQSEPYRYQPFASSGITSAQSAIGVQPAAAPEATAEPWRESLRQESVRQRYVPGGGVATGQSAAASGASAGGLLPGIHASSNGYVTITLSANNAAGFSYLFGWLSGIFFYFTERTNRFVRFHAWQSILLTSLFTVIAVILYVFVEWLTLTPHDTVAVVAGVVVAVLVLLAMFLVWLYTLIAAWSGHYLRLPILGNIAEHFAVPAPDPDAEGEGFMAEDETRG